jgi:hypothetical protein
VNHDLNLLQVGFGQLRILPEKGLEMHVLVQTVPGAVRVNGWDWHMQEFVLRQEP